MGMFFCASGITAVCSSEVLDIMCSDFPDKYEEFRKYMRDKQMKELSFKQKGMEKYMDTFQTSERIDGSRWCCRMRVSAASLTLLCWTLFCNTWQSMLKNIVFWFLNIFDHLVLVRLITFCVIICVMFNLWVLVIVPSILFWRLDSYRQSAYAFQPEPLRAVMSETINPVT